MFPAKMARCHAREPEFFRSLLGQVNRDAVIVLVWESSGRNVAQGVEFYPAYDIDVVFRTFVHRAASVYRAAQITGPFLISMSLRADNVLYPVSGSFPKRHSNTAIQRAVYPFPTMQADNLIDVDRIIRPFCDQAHQLCGWSGSPNFDQAGNWVAR